MWARERRVDLVVGGTEERGDSVGVEGGVETRAGWKVMAGSLPKRGDNLGPGEAMPRNAVRQA